MQNKVDSQNHFKLERKLIIKSLKQCDEIDHQEVDSIDKLYQYLMYQKTKLVQDVHGVDLNKIKEFITHIYIKKEIDKENWWFFEIGIPRAISEIIIVSFDHWDKDEINEVISTIRYFSSDYHFVFARHQRFSLEKSTGANLLELMYVHILLDKIEDKFDEKAYIGALENALQYVTEGDGFYEDGSFIQHKVIPYNGSYGLVFLNYIYLVSSLLFEQHHSESVKQFIKMVLIKSFIPLINDNYLIDITSGRSVSRKNYDAYEIAKSIKGLAVDLSNLFQFQLDLDNKGYFVFNQMKRYISKDHSIIGIALSGDNIHSHETMNGENIKGLYQGIGYVTYGLDDLYEPYGYHLLVNPSYQIGVTNSLSSVDQIQGLKVKSLISKGTKFEQGVFVSYGYIDPLTEILINKTYITYDQELIMLITAPNHFHTTLYHHFDVEQVVLDHNQFSIKRKQHQIYFKTSEKVCHKESLVNKSFHEINLNESEKTQISAKANYGFMLQISANTYYQMSFKETFNQFEIIAQNSSVHHMKVGKFHFISKFDDEEYIFNHQLFNQVGQIVIKD